jgi:uroporphyrinogen-III decarboxylase
MPPAHKASRGERFFPAFAPRGGDLWYGGGPTAEKEETIMPGTAAPETGTTPAPMTSRERLWAAFHGEPVDRVPIWLREGFPVITGPAAANDFRNAWQAEPLYLELFEYVRPHADDFQGWGVGGQNRLLMIPPKYIENEVILETPERQRVQATIHTPRGDLVGIKELQRGVATAWSIKEPIESKEDLAKLAEVPFEIDDEMIEASKANYQRAFEAAEGERLLKTFLSSPVVCISGGMPLQLFLELSFTEKEWFHELCAEITRRQLAIFERVFADGMETTITFGGSEQCTPPMMAPEGYDEYVVPYDGQLVRFFHDLGIPVQMHCHGKIRHALRGMLEMGIDATDPVEPPPAGDVTYAEARAITGEKLTLMGNLEWDMLESAAPEEIRAQVREILSHGKERLILAASAGPISAVSRRLVDNYKAFIDAALEYGS